MWNKGDFESILKYLGGDSAVELYEPLYAIAESDRQITTTLFEKTLDQVAFASEDYKRLRAFFIDWFSAHRTLTTVQRDISDLYVLPNEHLDELFRSYGYPFSPKLTYVSNRINYNKVSYFLDLVNIYKIKGTAASIAYALRYHGIPSVQIFEYMTKMRYADPANDIDNAIYFESILAKSIGFNIDVQPITLTFDQATGGDPHWMTSESKIITQQLNKNLHLPAKSPYFSVRIYMDMSQINILFAHINRKFKDQYDYILNNQRIPASDMYSQLLNKSITLVELYASIIYMFYKSFPNAELGEDQLYIYRYDGTPYAYSNITTEYNAIHDEQYSRDEREENLKIYFEKFVKYFIGGVFTNRNTAEELLTNIFPDTKNAVDNLFIIMSPNDLIGLLFEELSTWIKTYCSSYIPNLGYLSLGHEELERDLGGIIDFFKPYHARMVSTDYGLIFEDRLENSIRLGDDCVEQVEEHVIDWDTCNSKPCCEGTECSSEDGLSYSRDTYDCDSYYDIGGACDPGTESFKTEVEDHITDKIVMRKHGEIDVNALIENATHPETIVNFVQSGGFVKFDEGGYFDDQHACDVCFIQIDDIVIPDLVFDFYSSESYIPPQGRNVDLNVS